MQKLLPNWTVLFLPLSLHSSLLRELWHDPRTVGGRDALYHQVKQAYLGISRRRVWTFLKNQETHQRLRKQNVHPRVVQPLVSLKPGSMAIDLIDMQSPETM